MTTQFVRCIDDTLARGELTRGRVYEVWKQDVDYGLYYLVGFDKAFSATRFDPADRPGEQH